MNNESNTYKIGKFTFIFDQTGFRKLLGDKIIESFLKEEIISFNSSVTNSSVITVKLKNRKSITLVFPRIYLTEKQNIIIWLINTLKETDNGGCRHCHSPENLISYNMYYGYSKTKNRQATLHSQPEVVRFCNSCLKHEQKKSFKAMLSYDLYIICCWLIIIVLSQLKFIAPVNMLGIFIVIAVLILISLPVFTQNVKGVGKGLARIFIRNLKIGEDYTLYLEADELKKYPDILIESPFLD